MSRLKQMMERARESIAYWVEDVVLDFTSSIERLMREQDVSRAELGRRIGTSQAYVTKVLRGDANFTVRSMVQIARALNANVKIELVRQADLDHHYEHEWSTFSFQTQKFTRPRVVYSQAANEEWQTEKAA